MQPMLTRKIALGFAGSVMILGVIATSSFLSTHHLIEDSQDVTQIHHLLGEFDEIRNTITKMNSSVRGYIITAREDYLEPFMMGKDEIRRLLQEVRELTRTKPDQLRWLDSLEKLIGEQLAYSTNLIAMRKREGFPAAEAVVKTGSGQKRVASILKMVEQMLERESALLAERNKHAARGVWLANSLTVLGGVLAIIVVTLANLALRREILERERLERAILEISDREQLRFGHDLHDGVCQELAGIAFMGQVIERKLAAQSPAEAAEVGRMAKLAGEAVTHARSLARGLQPVAVETNGLMVALEELARNVQDMFHIQCRFVCEGQVLLADNTVAVHVYRIAQEAVHNAIRHGQAKQVEIRLRALADAAKLEVGDDGTGMPAVMPRQKGMGIETMRYRARMIGASLKIRPAATVREHGGRVSPHGTEVSCLFKLTPAPIGIKAAIPRTA